jgi:hypothetical protein
MKFVIMAYASHYADVMMIVTVRKSVRAWLVSWDADQVQAVLMIWLVSITSVQIHVLRQQLHVELIHSVVLSTIRQFATVLMVWLEIPWEVADIQFKCAATAPSVKRVTSVWVASALPPALHQMRIVYWMRSVSRGLVDLSATAMQIVAKVIFAKRGFVLLAAP